MNSMARLKGAIKTLPVDIRQPVVFVGKETGRERLEAAGVKVVVLHDMHDRIMKVSMAGRDSETE